MERFKLKKTKIKTAKLYEIPLKYFSENTKFEEGIVRDGKTIKKRYISLLSEETLTFLPGTGVLFRAIISKKERAVKKNGSPYIYVEVNDGEGVIGFPVWTNSFRVFDSKLNTTVLKEFEDLNVGDIVDIDGELSFYDGKPQIQNPTFTIAKEVNKIDYLPKYEMKARDLERFLDIVETLPDDYSKFAKRALGLDRDIEKWVKFMVAPAALKHHHSKLGGLFLHTLGVIDNIENMYESYAYLKLPFETPHRINYNRLILTAILHDIMKIEDYSGSYNFVTMMNHIKEEESFIEEEYIESDYFNKCDHIPKGAAYIREINKELNNILSREEVDNICYSILSHHGQWSPYPPKSIEDILLHLADMIDSQIFKFNETGGI